MSPISNILDCELDMDLDEKSQTHKALWRLNLLLHDELWDDGE